jgi:hypothetical protein
MKILDEKIFNSLISKDKDKDYYRENYFILNIPFPSIINILNNFKSIIKEIEENKISSKLNFNNNFNFNKSNIEIEENDIFNSNTIWVDNEKTLIITYNYLKNYSYLGIDLEYHSFKVNNISHGAICVIQISTTEKTFAIDAIKLNKESIIKHLKPIFESEKILKIFHGCDNDINYLISNYEIFCRNIIDTGRTFLVFEKFIVNKPLKKNQLPSLNKLSKIFLIYEMDKSYQKADWRIRPLTKSKKIHILYMILIKITLL